MLGLLVWILIVLLLVGLLLRLVGVALPAREPFGTIIYVVALIILIILLVNVLTGAAVRL